jgi:predicted ArsR family transcriptional regulator
MKSARTRVKRAVGRSFTTIASIAEETGLTSETVRLHLNALAEDGEIEARNGRSSGSVGRPARIFRKK